MNIENIVASLIKHEGVKPLPYLDSEGILTIGVGHNLKVPLTKAAMNQILSDDIATAISELDKNFPGWRDHSSARQDVLVELMFNLGTSRLKGFKRMWAALAKRDYLEASAQMLDSKWATQVKGRATTLADQMQGI